jgi:hypothetical protein
VGKHSKTTPDVESFCDVTRKDAVGLISNAALPRDVFLDRPRQNPYNPPP